MKSLRKLHLYLGCFFTPILLFFVVTGGLRYSTFTSRAKDGSYTAPRWLICSLMSTSTSAGSTRGCRLSVFAGAAGDRLLLLSSLIGIIIALQMSKRKSVVWLCLLGGRCCRFCWLMFLDLKKG